jgi:glycosyltransferase involved in cell wall biosynthesis
LENNSPKKIKILLAITLGEQGGAQKHLLSLANALDREKYQLSVLCGGGGEILKKINRPGTKKIHLPILVREIALFKDIKALFQLIKLFKKEKFDIIHAHSTKAGFLVRLAAKITGVKIIIYTAHGFVFQEPLNILKKLLYFMIEKTAAIFTNMIITVSHNDAGIARKLCSPNKILTIHNGISLNEYRNEQKDPKITESLGLEPENTIIGTVANYYPTKGLKYLFKALAKLPAGTAYQLLLVGDGPLKKKLTTLAKELNISSKIIFAGRRKDVPQLLKQMDIFVLSSLKEGFPYVILEALAAGLPVVSTKVGGIPEILTPQVSELAPPKDPAKLAEALLNMLNNKEKQKTAETLGPKMIQDNFSEKTMLERTEELYTKLLKANFYL